MCVYLRHYNRFLNLIPSIFKHAVYPYQYDSVQQSITSCTGINCWLGHCQLPPFYYISQHCTSRLAVVGLHNTYPSYYSSRRFFSIVSFVWFVTEWLSTFNQNNFATGCYLTCFFEKYSLISCSNEKRHHLFSSIRKYFTFSVIISY